MTKDKKKATLKDLIVLYGPFKKLMIFNLLCSIILSATNLAHPYIMRIATDAVLYKPARKAIEIMLVLILVYLVLLLISNICQYVSTVVASSMMDEIEQDLKERIFQHFQSLSFKYYDNHKTGTIVSLMDEDVNLVDEFMWSIPNVSTNILIEVVFAPIVFATLNLRLTLVIIPCLLGILIFELFYVNTMKPKFKLVREIMSKQFEYAEDHISGIRTTVSFNNQKSDFNRFHNMSKNVISARRKKWKSIYIHRAGFNAFNTVLYGIIVVYGGFLAINKVINIVDMTLFYSYLYMIVNPIRDLTELIKDYQSAIVSYQRINDFLSEKAEIINPENPSKPIINGNIEFKEVSFRYNIKNEENILTNINIDIKSGEFVGLVGPSGAGKSTIAGLIPRYYDTTEGSIQIDGINIKDIELGYLRRQIGVVQQEIYLFNGTIYDNISYAVPTASLDDVIKAAKMANAHKFISEMSDGYQTEIGERGIKLSGGQRQRIAIARLFLLNPAILIFDEATSALDEESQQEVQKAMESLSKNRTTIVIAHRLSTIKNADRILYLSKNGIEEDGSHSELIKKEGGLYRTLYEKSIKK